MPHPTPVPVRQVIRQLSEQGDGVTRIAEALGLVPRTVRHLLQRFRVEGQAAVAPSYPSRAISSLPQELVDEALRLRREHATWGAGLIRVFLVRKHPQEAVPAERTLQRWFERAGLSPAPKGRRPACQAQRAQRPHDVWQMDAAERVRLGNGTRACWLRIADEYSGAVLETAVFPPRGLEHGASYRNAGCLARGFQAVGTTPALSRGQRRTLGFVERFASGSDVVAAGLGRGSHPQSAPASPGQWRDRTFARDR